MNFINMFLENSIITIDKLMDVFFLINETHSSGVSRH